MGCLIIMTDPRASKFALCRFWHQHGKQCGFPWHVCQSIGWLKIQHGMLFGTCLNGHYKQQLLEYGLLIDMTILHLVKWNSIERKKQVSHWQGLFSSRLKETGPSTRMRQAPAVGNATWCLEIWRKWVQAHRGECLPTERTIGRPCSSWNLFHPCLGCPSSIL